MINEYRTTINDKVKDIGNRIKPNFLGLPKEFKSGLGDLLTADVNFARIGLVTGIALPFVGAYELLNLSSRNFVPPSGTDFIENTIFSVMLNAYFLFAPSLAGGIFGNLTGRDIDKYLQEKYCSYKSYKSF